ncbi:MAG: 3'(2'),5'-bisphosphate nucleotidase CysQ [Alphaproteobacteria bacterium]|nr:3'(2'),5'-bisphosphate nucleotidase CysQ [Alphaproteobacteria bacterium]
MKNTDATAAEMETMLVAAQAASVAISQIYDTRFAATTKGDGSPVTIADTAAEKIILKKLAPLGLPVLAEESVTAGDIPELGNRYFVVDPLDGTKEFIKRNGEFTVNIALVVDHRPAAGVVLAPALNLIYWGDGHSAWRADLPEDPRERARGERGKPQLIQTAATEPMRVVASRSHGHAQLVPLCTFFEVIEDISVGSSLKFCLVAEGRARLYPRFTPTCEWDTAAGQAVLQSAGGVVMAMNGADLTCGNAGKKFLNPFFVAASDADLAQRAADKMHELVTS